MKLDRNIPGREGRGKYALVLMRELELRLPQEVFGSNEVTKAIDLLVNEGIIDLGTEGTESEFFVIRLKDINAEKALMAYADAAREHDAEFAAEVEALTDRAGPNSPWCKEPD